MAKLLAVFLAGLSLCLGADSQRFTGTWDAKFKGAVICTIELKGAEKITGTASACNINVDSDGNLIEPEAATDAAEPSPILNAKLEAGTLTFELRDESDEHPTKMQMDLKGDKQAELRILDAPVRIKPIAL